MEEPRRGRGGRGKIGGVERGAIDGREVAEVGGTIYSAVTTHYTYYALHRTVPATYRLLLYTSYDHLRPATTSYSTANDYRPYSDRENQTKTKGTP